MSRRDYLRKQRRKSIFFDRNEVLLCACRAWRENGEAYFKTSTLVRVGDKFEVDKHSNRLLIMAMLGACQDKSVPVLIIEDVDREKAASITNHMKRYTLAILSDDLAEFQRSVYEVWCTDQIDAGRGVGSMAYLPELVKREIEDMQFIKKIRSIKIVKSVYELGDVYTGSIEIIRQRWSKTYSAFNYVGIYDDTIFTFMSTAVLTVGEKYHVHTSKVKEITKLMARPELEEVRLNHVRIDNDQDSRKDPT